MCSFIELVKFIFTIPGVSSFLSNRICQDPLENFFGQQRQRGRVYKNPSAKEFVTNTQALRVIQNTCKTIHGNCRGGNVMGKETVKTLHFLNTPDKGHIQRQCNVCICIIIYIYILFILHCVNVHSLCHCVFQ